MCCSTPPLIWRRHLKMCESQEPALFCPTWAALPASKWALGHTLYPWWHSIFKGWHAQPTSRSVPCWLVTGCRWFVTACHSHLQGLMHCQKTSRANYQQTTNHVQHPRTAIVSTSPQQKLKILHQIFTYKMHVPHIWDVLQFTLKLCQYFTFYSTDDRFMIFYGLFWPNSAFINILQRRCKTEILHQQGQVVV